MNTTSFWFGTRIQLKILAMNTAINRDIQRLHNESQTLANALCTVSHLNMNSLQPLILT